MHHNTLAMATMHDMKYLVLMGYIWCVKRTLPDWVIELISKTESCNAFSHN
ncbi:hypothetical protein MNBD_GAMMA18-1031 [hydrothermal vent metagenome]|uniref:Uncharacterized protein n=1 Tax=hydrothermal vent metagenome TaxID=652676 RepID=A0A3B0Z3L5_9ZZZZ